MSRLMGKPTICIGENKDADQLRGNREADQRLCFATRIEQFLFYFNLKFQASSSFLGLYRPVCVGPVRKPHCWFSHEAAQIQIIYNINPFVTNGLARHLGESTSMLGAPGVISSSTKLLSVNRIAPDCGLPRSTMSHLGLYCLTNSHQ